MVVLFVDLTEEHAFGFVIWDLESIFHGPFWYLVDILLDFSTYGSHIFGVVTNEEIITI